MCPTCSTRYSPIGSGSIKPKHSYAFTELRSLHIYAVCALTGIGGEGMEATNTASRRVPVTDAHGRRAQSGRRSASTAGDPVSSLAWVRIAATAPSCISASKPAARGMRVAGELYWRKPEFKGQDKPKAQTVTA